MPGQAVLATSAVSRVSSACGVPTSAFCDDTRKVSQMIRSDPMLGGCVGAVQLQTLCRSAHARRAEQPIVAHPDDILSRPAPPIVAPGDQSATQSAIGRRSVAQ